MGARRSDRNENSGSISQWCIPIWMENRAVQGYPQKDKAKAERVEQAFNHHSRHSAQPEMRSLLHPAREKWAKRVTSIAKVPRLFAWAKEQINHLLLDILIVRKLF